MFEKLSFNVAASTTLPPLFTLFIIVSQIYIFNTVEQLLIIRKIVEKNSFLKIKVKADQKKRIKRLFSVVEKRKKKNLEETTLFFCTQLRESYRFLDLLFSEPSSLSLSGCYDDSCYQSFRQNQTFRFDKVK